MEKKQIKVQDILAMLENGKTRKDIKEEYDLTTREMKKLFSHPKLKNKKTQKPVSFILVDEEEDVEVVENNIPKAKPTEWAKAPEDGEDDPIPESVEQELDFKFNITGPFTDEDEDRSKDEDETII